MGGDISKSNVQNLMEASFGVLNCDFQEDIGIFWGAGLHGIIRRLGHPPRFFCFAYFSFPEARELTDDLGMGLQHIP